MDFDTGAPPAERPASGFTTWDEALAFCASVTHAALAERGPGTASRRDNTRRVWRE